MRFDWKTYLIYCTPMISCILINLAYSPGKFSLIATIVLSVVNVICLVIQVRKDILEVGNTEGETVGRPIFLIVFFASTIVMSVITLVSSILWLFP